MSREETVSVRIPKAMADDIQQREWFKYYHDLDDFVTEATRDRKMSWMRTEVK